MQENIATILELRARKLKKSIQQLLEETDNSHALTDSIYQHPNISTLYQNTYTWVSFLSKSVISIITLVLINFFPPDPLMKYILLITALFLFSFVWPKLTFLSGNPVGSSYITDSTIFAQTAVEVIKDKLTNAESEFSIKANEKENEISIGAKKEADQNSITDKSEIDKIIERMTKGANLTADIKGNRFFITKNIYNYFTDINLTVKDSDMSA